MKTYKHINHNKAITILGIVLLFGLSSAQYKQIDSVGNVNKKVTIEHLELRDTTSSSHKTTDSVKLKHKNIDVSSCFEDGFLFKTNSLSHI